MLKTFIALDLHSNLKATLQAPLPKPTAQIDVTFYCDQLRIMHNDLFHFSRGLRARWVVKLLEIAHSLEVVYVT